MAHSASLFMTRIAGIIIAGMLLFAMFGGHARAENLDGYGLAPVAGGNDFAPATAVVRPGSTTSSNNGFSAAPSNTGYGGASGGYAPANSGYTPAPPPSSLSVPVQANGTYAAPLGSSAPAAVTVQPPYQPPVQPAYQPVTQQAYQAAPVGDYGYKPDTQPQSAPYGYKADGPPQQLAAAYTQPPAYRPSMASMDSAAYGYKADTGPVAGGYQPVSYGRANADYVLGPGDKLKLNVFDETDLSGDYTIDGSGYVRLPLIGQVRAAGYTAQQLEGAIGSALAQGYLKSPRVAVEVSTYRPFYIIGAVNRPGEYPYVNHMNALNAIALAGGYLPTAVESVVYIRREGSNQEVRMTTDRATQIYPGDVVRVNNTVFSDAMSWLSPLAGPLSIAAAAAIP
jgi:polysaccharide export outer membrane protein